MSKVDEKKKSKIFGLYFGVGLKIVKYVNWNIKDLQRKLKTKRKNTKTSKINIVALDRFCVAPGKHSKCTINKKDNFIIICFRYFKWVLQ